jgi:preprotein translocase SecE subunit
VVSVRSDREDGAPAPLAHAAPDVELAEAQLAVGRDPEIEADAGVEGPLGDDDGAQNGELADEDATELRDGGGSGARAGTLARRTGDGAGHGTAVAEPRPHLVARLSAFLQGCWHELQRVQWPDRRQVMQATGVVIGFVIVAGLFLGLADWVAQHIVKFVLK